MTGDAGPAAPPNALGVLLTNVKNALLAFNWRGDTAWVNNVPLEPFLDPVSGALFVLGCAYCLYRLVRFRELPMVYLPMLIFVGMLPSIISIGFPVENPATARSSMALPVVAVIAALAARLLIRRVRVLVGGTYGIVSAVVVTGLLLGSVLRLNFHEYFHVYPRQYLKTTQHISPVAGIINGFFAFGGTRRDAHIVLWPHWIDARSVAIQTGEPYWDPVIPSAEDVLQEDGVARQRLYLVHPADEASLEKLGRWYPGALVQEHRLPVLDNVPYIVSWLIPAGSRADR